MGGNLEGTLCVWNDDEFFKEGPKGQLNVSGTYIERLMDIRV